jgi:hypothetical protein
MVTIETISIVFTGISVSLAAFYYINTLRNTRKNQQLQLDARQAQLMMQIWNRYDEHIRDGIDAWIAVEYEGFQDFWDNYSFDSNPDFWVKARRAVSWYEHIGVLVKAGLLDIHLIALAWAGNTRMFWEKVGPLLPGFREVLKYPRAWSETEWLCKELIKYMDEHPELKT